MTLICALALVLRALVVVNMQESGIFADMQDYYDRAVHLLNTGTLWPDAFRVPLFPIFIAAVFKLAGQSLQAVRVAQVLLGVATVALTYILARRVASERGAVFAAVIVAIYPALLLYSVYLMAETLFTFLVVAALVLWAREGVWAALGCGVLLALAVLTRSAGLALLGGIVLADMARVVLGRYERLGPLTLRSGMLLIGFTVALTPWVQRNYMMYGRMIPTDTSSGFNALLGNYEGATGRHPGIPAVDAAAQRYWRNTRNDVERSDVGLQVARDFVRSEPLRAATLALRKVGYLFGVEGREHAWGYSFHLHGRRDSSTVWAWGIAIIASFPVVMLLACVGLLRPGLSFNAVAMTIAATLLGVVLIHVASFGDSRFHLPWLPLLAILAARAFAPLLHAPWTTFRQTMLAVVVVALGLTWIGQAQELLAVLPRLAESPTPLQLPY